MSHTGTSRTTTSNRRGRGRGPGNQQNGNNRSNSNNDFKQRSNHFRTHSRDRFRSDNQNKESNWKQPDYKGINQNRGHGNFRGRNNNNSNVGGGSGERSHSSCSNGSSSSLRNMPGNQQSGNYRSNEYTEFTQQPNHFQTQYNSLDCNQRSGNEWKQSDYKENYQHNKGRGNFRGRGDFKNVGREAYERSHSSSTTGSTSNLHDMQSTASRLSRHAQNPIFVGELMERFNSILPTSNLLVPDEPSFVQQRIIPNQSKSENLTFASISSNITQGFRPSRRRSPVERSTAHGSRDINEESNNFRSSSHGRFNERDFRTIQPARDVSDSLVGNDRQKPKLSEKVSQEPRDIANKQNSKLSNVDNAYTNEAVSSLGETLFSQLDALDARRAKESSKPRKKNRSNFQPKQKNNIIPQDNNRTNAPKSSSLPYNESCRNNELTPLDLPRQMYEYNRFLDSQKPSDSKTQNKSQQQSVSPVQHLSRNDSETLSSDVNKSNTAIGNKLAFIHADVAGGMTPFNIQQRLASTGQRVPSREEVLTRKEEEYRNQAAEFKLKEIEKEAKKREKYLAKYAYVDSGHVLGEGYLNEAAGYDHGLVPFLLSEEEARRIQQERLSRDASAFREREREEDQKRALREKADKEKRLKKHSHIDAGHRLGHRENQDAAEGIHQLAAGPPGRTPSSGALHIGDHRSVSQHPVTLPETSTSQEFMLKGESPEEFLERQQEQLLLESLILSEQAKEEERRIASSQLRQEELLSKKPNQALKNPQSPGTVGNAFKVATPPPVSVVKPIQTSPPVAKPNDEDAEIKKQKLLSQLDMLIAKSAKPQKSSTTECKSVIQEPSGSQNPLEVTKPIKPAVCVVKNSSQGAVLVVRPTEEALNKTLINYVEVVDEMDKLGHSSLYKPQAEQIPLYSNNRFDWKPSDDTTKAVGEWRPSADYAKAMATGALPEQTPPSPLFHPPELPQPECKPSTTKNEQIEPEPVIDYQAELRAARLKMQRKYEESLKKQKEQEN